jgi:hypothetical protein
VVTNVAAAARGIETSSADDSAENTATSLPDDGTPIEGMKAPPPGDQGGVEASFVAGEIDVPTPGPERDVAPVDFAAAGGLLGPPAEKDPDTGNFTPPLERR